MLEKTFTMAGIARRESKYNGRLMLHYGNSARWLRVLNKWYKDIDIVDLPYPMTKMGAIQHLLDKGFAGKDVEVQELLLNTLAKSPKASYPKRKDPFADVDAVLAQAAEQDLEDSPY